MTQKHVIFLVHGMGNFETGWSKEPGKQLDEIYSSYAPSIPFGECYEVIEIRYDNFFTDYLERYKTEGKKFRDWAELLPDANDSIVSSVVDLASTVPEENFATTHVLDVALYATTLLQNQVIEYIKLTMLNRLNGSGYVGWSVIAHSLGTRVMHDVLQELYTSTDFRQAYGKPRVLGMLANVSRLMAFSEGDGIYKSAVVPSLTRTEGACQNYLSARHALDPIPAVKPFEPPYSWGNNRVMDRGLFLPVRIPSKEITEFNVHDFDHYLQHPDIHVPILNLTYEGPPMRSQYVTKEMYLQAMEDHRQQTLPENLQGFTGQLEDLKLEKLTPFINLLKQWKKFREILDSGQ